MIVRSWQIDPFIIMKCLYLSLEIVLVQKYTVSYVVVGRMPHPHKYTDTQALSPETCEYVILHGKGDFEDVTKHFKMGGLSWINHLGEFIIITRETGDSESEKTG